MPLAPVALQSVGAQPIQDGGYVYSRAAAVLSPATGLLIEATTQPALSAIVLLRFNVTAPGAPLETLATVPCAPPHGVALTAFSITLFVASSDAVAGDTLVLGAGCGVVVLRLPPPTSPPSLQQSLDVVWRQPVAAVQAVSTNGALLLSLDTGGYTVRRVDDGTLLTTIPSRVPGIWSAAAVSGASMRMLALRDGSGYVVVLPCAYSTLDEARATLYAICGFSAADGAWLWSSYTADDRLAQVAWLNSLSVRDVRALGGTAPARSCARHVAGAPPPDQTALIVATGYSTSTGYALYGIVADTGALAWRSLLTDPRLLAPVARHLPAPPRANLTIVTYTPYRAVCEVPGTDLFLALMEYSYAWRDRYGNPQVVGNATLITAVSFRATTGTFLDQVVLGTRAFGIDNTARHEMFPIGHPLLVLGDTCRTAFAAFPNISTGASTPPGPLLLMLGVDPWTGVFNTTAAVMPADGWLPDDLSFVFTGPCAGCVTVSSALLPVYPPDATVSPPVLDLLAALASNGSDDEPGSWLAATYVVLRGAPLPPIAWHTSPVAWHPVDVAAGASVATVAAVLSVGAAFLASRALRPRRACACRAPRGRHTRLHDDDAVRPAARDSAV